MDKDTEFEFENRKMVLNLCLLIKFKKNVFTAAGKIGLC
ncbi:hypothetical protein BD847_3972 [Flavobacterium cutihirudinis]|uniref:Uncharacterized protein n=1 Tax=Flavobacterium cutihirudinis TaxID=1265740 RepID=A0A3D9FKJ5_9FLAO|nr:hypothetical protein BD847_3972 [Flavobacterium cutihirudinis]